MRRSGHHLPTGRFCPVESDRVDPTFFLLFNYLRSILGDFPHGTTFAVRMTGLLGRRFMNITTSLAASRLVAQQRAMDIKANNIANANTPGFRTERVQFSDWIDRQPASAPGGRTVTYTQDRATYRESQPGTLTHTANPLDLALTGEGYFTVNTKAGPRLTRDGRFGLMPDGTVADSNGNAALDTTGKPIQIAPTDTQVSIAGDGSISTENGPVGKIGVVQPADPMKLRAEGATNFISDTTTTQVASPGIVP